MKQQERSSRSRKAILEAAAEEFAARGYAATNLYDIVAHTSLSKGALYAHFPSKSHLATALTEKFQRTWDELLRQAADPSRPPLAALRDLTLGLIEILGSDACFTAGLRLTWDEAHAQGRPPTVQSNLLDTLTGLIRDAQRGGGIDAGQDPELLGILLLGLLIGVHHTTARQNGHMAAERVRRLWDMLAPIMLPAARPSRPEPR
ncbi:TetR/AcrR family transcriptional regulator [Spongiactinospora rosea]|nr:TetR/AcrR family transcriptional regulator [Spongiactinospora rosea]